MTKRLATPDRLGDKDLPFKRCERCDEKADLYVIDGDTLCAGCLAEEDPP